MLAPFEAPLSGIFAAFGQKPPYERRLLGLGTIDPDDFALEFRLMTIQRGLKATGTFSYQTAVAGRSGVYQQFIQPTLEIVVQAAEWLERFPTLRRMLKERIN